MYLFVHDIKTEKRLLKISYKKDPKAVYLIIGNISSQESSDPFGVSHWLDHYTDLTFLIMTY